MALVIRQYINLHGDNPLAATVAGTHFKAWLVANLALNDGPQATAERYRLPLADVYGALAFHYDNQAAIDEAIRHSPLPTAQTDARVRHERRRLGPDVPAGAHLPRTLLPLTGLPQPAG